MSDETNSHYLDELQGELCHALGDAVWSFARIEWLTYHYLGALSEDKVDELVGDVPFRARVGILKRMIERMDRKKELKENALSILKEAEKLAERRNIIVHNPWRVWVDFDDNEYRMEFQKFLNRDRTISLDELREYTAQTNDVQARFKEAFDAL